MASAALPDPKVYITDNRDDGESFFSTMVPETAQPNFDFGGAPGRLVYSVDRNMQLDGGADLKQMLPALEKPEHIRKDGIGLWYVDTPPGGESPMHRTVSVDYAVLVSGHVELMLESGETRLLNPGDTVVQRSTGHKWRNTSDTEWSRIFFVCIGIDPVVTQGAGPLGAYLGHQ